MDPSYSLEEASRILGMHPDELQDKARRRQVRASFDGKDKTWRFLAAYVDELARQRSMGSIDVRNTMSVPGSPAGSLGKEANSAVKIAVESQKIVIYVSSEIDGLRDERRVLHERVFPGLRRACERSGMVLDVIDPCWRMAPSATATETMSLEECVDGVERCRPFFIAIIGERFGRPVGLIPETVAGRFPHLRFLGGYSRTAIEIIHGVLNDPAQADCSVFLFRRASYFEAVPEDHRTVYASEGPDASFQLQSLKQAIRASNRPVIEYDCQWDHERQTITGLDDFFRAAFHSLRDQILSKFANSSNPSAFLEACGQVEHELAPRLESRIGPGLIADESRLSASAEASETGQEEVEPDLDENVQFTVFRPEVVRPEVWHPLLAFAHLSERPPGAPKDEPDPVEEVQKQAAQVLGERRRDYQDSTQDSQQAVPRAGEITFVPVISGFEFNPPRRSFLRIESVHKEEFRFRAAAELDGKTARGRLTVFLGSIILAEVSLAIRVDRQHQPAPESEAHETERAQPYRKIFASYSHKDVEIVCQFERYARTFGDDYLRDWVHLRAGEVWNERLYHMIDQADVFQLFWSSHSMNSSYVRQEWEYALSLGRPHFIRPTYWEEPLPVSPQNDLPPETLRRLHFQRVPVQRSRSRTLEPSSPAAPGNTVPSPAKTPLPARQPSAASKPEKDIFVDTDFEVDGLDADRDSDDRTMQLEAQSDFELEDADTGSEVFAIDEEDVDQNAAIGPASASRSRADDDDDALVDLDDAGSGWDVETDTAASARPTGRPVSAPALSTRGSGPSDKFKIVAIIITVSIGLAIGGLFMWMLSR